MKRLKKLACVAGGCAVVIISAAAAVPHLQAAEDPEIELRCSATECCTYDAEGTKLDCFAREQVQ
jgi:hypothetical protein